MSDKNTFESFYDSTSVQGSIDALLAMLKPYDEFNRSARCVIRTIAQAAYSQGRFDQVAQTLKEMSK